MFDLWSPEHSVLREKVVEHIFLAELSKVLLLELGQPFEVLRAEFDGSGYDVVIEAAGVFRHIQLKATARTGKRGHVDVQVALANKPGGCVIWIFVDPASLALGPFLWLGGDGGKPLPDLGDREVRHSRGDATGAKKVRAGLRRVPRGMFTRFDTVHDLAMAMFPLTDHNLILERHLADRNRTMLVGELARALTWESSAPLAYMIDGYALADAAKIEDPTAFLDRMRADAERSGRWEGTTLELWLALFMEHRRDHFSGPIGVPFDLDCNPPLLDELCAALTQSLAEGPDREQRSGPFVQP